MTYIVGISSGIFGAAQPHERMQYLGISNKVNYCITQGVTFTQVDVETMSEFKDPQIGIDDEEKLKAWKEKVKGMNITMGFHGESAAMGGRDTPIKFDSAIEDDYVRSHDRLVEVLENAGKLGAKYYLLHSSESTPFIMLGKEFQPANLVDIWGRKFREFIDSEKWVDDWIFGKGDFIWISILNRPLKDYLEHSKEQYADTIEYKQKVAEGKSHEDIIREMEGKERNELKRYFKGHIASRSLTYGSERYAYWIIAKWMEMNNDRLWNDIAVKEWKKLQENKKVPQDSQPTIENEFFREHAEGMSCWVPAVAAKYLWGHFNQEKCPTAGPVKEKDPKKWLDKYGMYFIIETPMAQAGMENLMRLSDPVHMCILAEVVDFKYFRVALDFEHVLSNYINPQDMIARLAEGHGNLFKVIHLGWPTPVIPAHMPIYVGSDQHRWIYQRLYELRQKGFTPDDDRYLIYERGSENIEQSIVAMRLIVEFLKDNVEPGKLPPKFFGIEGPSLASEQRQRTIIQQHARDPIEGLIVVPEEGFTLLGKAATEKVGAEKWKKEELA
jgi:hypothetical protein